MFNAVLQNIIYGFFQKYVTKLIFCEMPQFGHFSCDLHQMIFEWNETILGMKSEVFELFRYFYFEGIMCKKIKLWNEAS